MLVSSHSRTAQSNEERNVHGPCSPASQCSKVLGSQTRDLASTRAMLCNATQYTKRKEGGGDNLLFHVMPHNPAILGKTEPISGKNIATLTLHFLLA